MRTHIVVFLAFLLNLSSTAWADSSVNGPSPSTELTPTEVIRIVVEALKTNDTASGDEGIATVWRFAAPSNKAVTGPLPRFSAMLKRGFGEMFNHIDDDYGPIEIQDDVAMQPVWLVTPQGDEVAYMFRVRRQSEGEFDGMWMTESVYPIAPKKRGKVI